MNEKELLIKMNSIRDAFNLLNKKSGKSFNIFEVANISTNEVKICRVIYELISPKGSHGQGFKYLEFFLRTVLSIKDVSEAELNTVRVYRELVIKDERRIDLVIETDKRFIPIEVKIYAEDQEKQCFDYFEKTRHMHINKNTSIKPVLYYLTRSGYEPSEASACGLEKAEEGGFKGIKQISFANEIISWLEECIKHASENRLIPIQEIGLQLISVIKAFTNQEEDEVVMEVNKILMSSSENMKSAISLTKCVEIAKVEKLKEFFMAIDEGVKILGAEKNIDVIRVQNEYDYEFDNFKRIREYYSYQKSSLPGVSYKFNGKIGGRDITDIWVRLEVDWHIYVGYCYTKNIESNKIQLSEKEIKELVGDNPKTSDSWIDWTYIPEEAENPDFKNLDEAWFKLFDKKYFDDIVNECSEKIITLLQNNEKILLDINNVDQA